MNPSNAMTTEAMDDFHVPARLDLDRVQPPAGDGPSRTASGSVDMPAAARAAEERPKNLYDRIEAFVSRLSMRDNFWNSICSLIWLPLAFFSGIRMKELDPSTFAARAVL